MLYFCVWPDEASLIVDVVDQAAAIAAATEDAGGKPPVVVRPIPCGVVALRVHFDEDENGDEVVSFEPLPHVEAALGVLEDALTPDDGPPCGAEAEDDAGALVRCELAAGHDPSNQHKAGELVWTQ